MDRLGFSRYIEFNDQNDETVMNVEKSIQLNRKITLLVTDPPIEPTLSEPPVTDLDADKLLKDLPVDEFFDALEEASSEQLQTLISGFEQKPLSDTKLQGLFDVPDGSRSAQDIFVWWEFRRLPFNAVVGSVGSVFLLYQAFGPSFWGVLFTAVIYAVHANMCYSLGAPTEIVIRACTRACFEKTFPVVGPVLLKLTIGFFVFITVVGGLLMCTLGIAGGGI